MRRLRTLIVDDEALARRGLEIRLRRRDDVEICGFARNGREALALLTGTRPDVVLLDIQMPCMDGFEVLEQMACKDMPAVIFVTAYDRYAIRAFEASALDYLLKPIDDERLDEAMDRARRRLDALHALEHRQRLLRLVCELSGREISLDKALAAPDAGHPGHPPRLAIRDGGTTRFVDMAAIDWVDAAGDYMCIHVDGETLVMRSTMKELESALDPATFVRIHRSTIVNQRRVVSLRPHRNGEYFVGLECGRQLKLSRGYRSAVRQLEAGAVSGPAARA